MTIREVYHKQEKDQFEEGFRWNSQDIDIEQRGNENGFDYVDFNLTDRGENARYHFRAFLDVPLPFSGTSYRSGDYKFIFELRGPKWCAVYHLVRVMTRAEMDAEDAVEYNKQGVKDWNDGKVLDAAYEWRRAADKGNADAKENLQKFASQIAAAEAAKEAQERAREAARRAQEAREAAAEKVKKLVETILALACAAGGAAAFGLIPGFSIVRLIAGAIIGGIAGFSFDKDDISTSFMFAGAGIGAIAIGTVNAMYGGLLNTILGVVGGAIGGGILGGILGKIFENVVLRVIFIVAVVAAAVFFGRPYYMPFVPSWLSKGITAVTASADETVTVTSDALNLRARAYGDAEIIKTLKKGDILKVTGSDINGWLPVEHEGKHGYVSKELVE